MRNENTPIAVEGFPFIFVGVFLTFFWALLGWKIMACIGLVWTLFVVFFFRNPDRRVPAEENAVIAPADGKVIYVGNVHEPHLDAETVKVSIFMSVFNVHVNRAPITAKVLDTFYIKGKFLDVRDERATFENEQCGLVLETLQGARMVVVQVAGLIARRIVCYPDKGDNVRRGERYGLIRFGSRLDVYLPKEVALQVRIGDKTVAGETILGILS